MTYSFQMSYSRRVWPMIPGWFLYKGVFNPNFGVQAKRSSLEIHWRATWCAATHLVAILITGSTTLLILEVETSSLGGCASRFMLAISASVLNRTSSKIKTVRPSVELKDRVILLNYILKLNWTKGSGLIGCKSNN
jgi:hypothetical protein